jgi:hypothetical protein
VFNVQRLDFVSRLWDLTKAKSVVLTGAPGVGKSWTVGQIIKKCKQQNRKFLPLAAEDFDIKSIDELRESIGFKTDVLSVLASFGPESLLIIDGLDALRGEPSQKTFRNLMESVNDRVQTCNILVTVRTFDLRQSSELQHLFFDFRNPRPFESVTTSPFSDEDLDIAAQQVPSLQSVLTGTARTEIRDLLRIPFNLRLAVELLETGFGIDEFSTIHSQVQLLQRYWFMRVESAPDGFDRKELLRQIVREMVDRKALSIREETAYSPGHSKALRSLRSAEVLRESVTDRVSFSHNILFDYAVARLLLDEEEIFGFLKTDSSRIIFFRPSVLHFFHHLWWNNRDVFWTLAFRFLNTDELPERAKVVPAIVITDASRSLSDVESILEDQAARKSAVPIVLRAVQALGSLESRQRSLWLGFLEKLSFAIELEFINEFVAVLWIANQHLRAVEKAQIGSISRRFLKWMWNTADTVPRHQGRQIASIAASRVIPIVMGLYETDAVASREIVESVLNRLDAPSASSNNAFWLAQQIRHIIDNDSELAVNVYERMFSHVEESDETTVTGGNPVFTMTSTRKQDFEIALYGLQQAFPYFLDHSPIHAAIAAVRATNAEVFRRELTENDRRNTPKQFTFRFLNVSAKYQSDFSEIWDHGAQDHLSLQLLNAVLQKAEEMKPPGLREIVEVIAQNLHVAVGWKRLFEAASRNIKTFFSYISALLAIPRILAAPEMTVVAGNVLKAAYAESLPKKEQKEKIENAIERIPRSRYIKRYEKAESIQNRLLLCIGADQLLSSTLRTRAEELTKQEPQFANEPYVRISGGAMSYSTEDWLRDRGSDTTKKENVEILEAIKPLTEFEHKFINAMPSVDECVGIEPLLKRLQDLLQGNDVDPGISEHARGVLYAVVESVLKNPELGVDHRLVQFCKTLLLQGVVDPSPKFDPKYHLSFDMPSWGSPIPRIEAAQGVSHFIWNYGLDDQVVGAFEQLCKDPVPAVRYQVAVGLPGFYKHDAKEKLWNLAEEMIDFETTSGVILGLVGSLERVAGLDPEHVVKLLGRAVEHGLPATDRTEATRALVRTLTGLYAVRNHAGAREQLARFEAQPVRYASEVASEIFTASPYLIPRNADEAVRSRARELFSAALSSCYEQLQHVIDLPNSEEKAKAINKLLDHVDEVAMRVYFSLDLKTELRMPDRALEEEDRRRVYFELKPLIAALATGSGGVARHHLRPRTAHFLMEIFTGVLRYEPGEMIKLAAKTCKAASALSYQFDAMAISEVVKLVERSLADYKEALKDPSVATALGEMLDLFVRAGWPEALRLTFKLDDAVR